MAGRSILSINILSLGADNALAAAAAAAATPYRQRPQVENIHNVASAVGERAAKEVKQAVKADAKMFDSIGEAAARSFKSSSEAIAATGKAIGAGAANLATAPFGLFRKEAHKTSEKAHKEAKQAVVKAAKGVSKVKRAVAKAADENADALEDTAEAAARAVKRAAIKDSIAKKVAAMKVHKAVGAGVKAVLKP
jgi:hypothetical protein